MYWLHGYISFYRCESGKISDRQSDVPFGLYKAEAVSITRLCCTVLDMAQRLRNWCFTSYDLDSFVVPDRHPDFRYCVYQTEECPETHRWHHQGYIEFNKALAFGTVKELLGDRSVHLEARRGTREQARAYCMKPESRVAGPLEFGTWGGSNERARTDLNEARLKIQAHNSWNAVVNDPELCNVVARHANWARQVYDNRTVNLPEGTITRLYNWQNEVLALLREPVKPRRIIWIWSAESGTGKSTFFDYCCRLPEFTVLPGSDYDNTLYAYDGQGILWFDLTRAQSAEHIPYHALEKFSNATFHLSKKYASVRKHVSAHVVVTANIAPDETKLPDRCVLVYATKIVAPQNE